MGHLLSTTNPAAVERINGEGQPLPVVGTMVAFHPRPGDVRRGRKKVAAVVTGVDESNRLLELTVIYNANDLVTVERVPQYAEGERGWSPIREPGDRGEEIGALRDQVERLTKILLGDFEAPEESVMAMLDLQDERLGTVEDQVKAAVVVKEPVAPKRRLRGNRG